MTLRTYLILFSAATVCAWFGWVVILSSVSPDEADGITLLLFYLTLTVGLFGLFSLLGFFFRSWFSHEQRIYRHVATATRQGGILAAFIVLLLLLQAQQYLFWWNVLLLAIIMFLIEFFFMEKKQS